MAKKDEAEAGEKMITMTVAEYEAAKAEAAANAAVHTARGDAALEGATMSTERRVSIERGTPIPDRRPWGMLSATFSFERSDWAGPVTGTIEFKVKDVDADGQKLETPVITSTKVTWKLPPLKAMQAKHGFTDDRNVFAPDGFGRKRDDIKEGAWFTMPFLQHVVKAVYEVSLQAELQGKDLRFVKSYLTSELKPIDLGEFRRERGVAGQRDGRVS
jgi:hypothetical protein